MSRQSFGERLRARREYLDLSQQDLADRLGIGRVTVSNWERGERGIDVDDIPRLAKALRVPVSYFFDDDQADTDPTDEADEQELLHYYRGIPRAQRPQAKKVLRAFVSEDAEYTEGRVFGKKVE